MNFLTRLSRINQTTGLLRGISRFLHTEKLSNNVNSNVPILANLSLSNHWIWQKNDAIGVPFIPTNKIEIPNNARWIPIPLIDPEKTDVLEAPSSVIKDEKKEAVRLIIIRRKKMKKHKLRKLRKKMKFVWAKRRARRELKKEKLFQAQLIKQCKEAEAFSAEAYVEEKIKRWQQAIAPPEPKKHPLLPPNNR